MLNKTEESWILLRVPPPPFCWCWKRGRFLYNRGCLYSSETVGGLLRSSELFILCISSIKSKSFMDKEVNCCELWDIDGPATTEGVVERSLMALLLEPFEGLLFVEKFEFDSIVNWLKHLEVDGWFNPDGCTIGAIIGWKWGCDGAVWGRPLCIT